MTKNTIYFVYFTSLLNGGRILNSNWFLYGYKKFFPFYGGRLMNKNLLALALGGLMASGSVLAESDPLRFNPEQYQTMNVEVDGKTFAVRAYENIVYVANPVNAEYQSLNIYIPEAYFQGESIEGFNADNAPIFMPNQIGGYMPAKAGVPGKGMGAKEGQADAMQTALSKGYVVASPGARGRTQADGKAPAVIVDLKAAVRYLRYNDAVMAGDAEKIISNGTSAGGALSVLLGATGNQADYAPYLQALGAAEARDDIFAVSAYCPISILDQADKAYEWQFNGVNDYQKIDVSMLDYHVARKTIKGTLDEAQQQVSQELKALFPDYLNGLNLVDDAGEPLRLDGNGEGSFSRYVAQYIQQSAQQALDSGKDLSEFTWLQVSNGKVAPIDFKAYAQGVGRQKTPPAFDALDLSAGENQLFGTASVDSRHFTAFSMAHNQAQNAELADAETVKLMNPMHYINQDTAPQHWRIRVGTNDRDTSLAISAILNAKLRQNGKTVDYAMPWNVPHSGDYDLPELFAWIKSITQE